MAIKVVQGFVGKQGVDQQRQVQDAQQQSAATTQKAIPAQIQSSIARAVQTGDAVITTLRSLARGKVEGGNAQPIKDENEAKEVAKDLSDKIREGKDEALATHDGLNSTKSGAVLVN